MRRTIFCYSVFFFYEVMIMQAAGGQELLSLQKLPEPKHQEIPGTMLSQEEEAHRVALKAYFALQGGVSATESDVISIVTIGFDIPNFAKRGEKLWEVRFTEMGMNGVERMLRAILWIHPETSAIHALVGPWMETFPVFHGKNTNISPHHAFLEEQRIKDMAFTAYTSRQHLDILAEEAATTAYATILGFTIPNFASKGDNIWEVHIEYMLSQLRAILWINPATEKIVFIIDSKMIQEKEHVQREGK